MTGFEERFEAWRHALTPTEGAILECLCRHGGEWITKAQIVREAYQRDYIPADDNLIHSHMANLRKKLGERAEIRCYKRYQVRGRSEYTLARLDDCTIVAPTPQPIPNPLRRNLTPHAEQMAAAFAAVRA